MKYYYRMNEVPDHDRDQYFTNEEIDQIPVYPQTPEILDEIDNDQTSDLRLVYSIDGFSWDPIECKNVEEARDHLGRSLNMSVYEYIHDL